MSDTTSGANGAEGSSSAPQRRRDAEVITPDMLYIKDMQKGAWQNEDAYQAALSTYVETEPDHLALEKAFRAAHPYPRFIKEQQRLNSIGKYADFREVYERSYPRRLWETSRPDGPAFRRRVKQAAKSSASSAERRVKFLGQRRSKTSHGRRRKAIRSEDIGCRFRGFNMTEDLSHLHIETAVMGPAYHRRQRALERPATAPTRPYAADSIFGVWEERRKVSRLREAGKFSRTLAAREKKTAAIRRKEHLEREAKVKQLEEEILSAKSPVDTSPTRDSSEETGGPQLPTSVPLQSSSGRDPLRTSLRQRVFKGVSDVAKAGDSALEHLDKLAAKDPSKFLLSPEQMIDAAVDGDIETVHDALTQPTFPVNADAPNAAGLTAFLAVWIALVDADEAESPNDYQWTAPSSPKGKAEPSRSSTNDESPRRYEHEGVVEDKAGVGGEVIQQRKRRNGLVANMLWQKPQNATEIPASHGGVHEQILQLLVTHGADIRQQDIRDIKDGYTAMHYAAERRSRSRVEWLSSRQVDVDIVAKYNVTPLMIAAKKGDHQLCLELLRLGANISMKNADGNTALHYAVLANAAAATKVLLLAGADKLEENGAGETALDLAKGLTREVLLVHALRKEPVRNYLGYLLEVSAEYVQRVDDRTTGDAGTTDERRRWRLFW